MATPHVAGAAALLLQGTPAAPPATVDAAIIANATPGKVTNPGTGSPNRLLYSTSARSLAATATAAATTTAATTTAAATAAAAIPCGLATLYTGTLCHRCDGDAAEQLGLHARRPARTAAA